MFFFSLSLSLSFSLSLIIHRSVRRVSSTKKHSKRFIPSFFLKEVIELFFTYKRQVPRPWTIFSERARRVFLAKCLAKTEIWVVCRQLEKGVFGKSKEKVDEAGFWDLLPPRLPHLRILDCYTFKAICVRHTQEILAVTSFMEMESSSYLMTIASFISIKFKAWILFQPAI